MGFMQTESVLQSKNRSGPAKNRFSVALGPGHAKMCLMPYANNKGADQPVRSLISTFVVCCLDSMICIFAISKVSGF